MDIPKSAKRNPTVYRIPVPAKVLVISDLHVPYHDPEAVRVALEFGAREKCDVVVINGDLIDCHELSSFAKKEDRLSPRDEFDRTVEMLKCIQNYFPGKKIYYTEGNHEVRYARYMYRQARELANDPYFTLRARLGVDSMGILYVPEYDRLRVSKLYLEHGHLLTRGKNMPVSPARTALLRTVKSVVIGHHHRTSDHQKVDIEDTINAAWSTGCLCELHPPYDPHAEWNHGFAIVEAPNDRIFRVRNYRMHDYEVL